MYLGIHVYVLFSLYLSPYFLTDIFPVYHIDLTSFKNNFSFIEVSGTGETIIALMCACIYCVFMSKLVSAYKHVCMHVHMESKVQLQE